MSTQYFGYNSNSDSFTEISQQDHQSRNDLRARVVDEGDNVQFIIDGSATTINEFQSAFNIFVDYIRNNF